jgi:hypothetical protein
MKKLPLIAVAALALSLGAPALALADMVTFKANLQPSSEVPPNTSTGSGALDATYDTSSKDFSWKSTYAGLTGPTTMAHFHGPAPVGQNAAIVVPIPTNALASPIQGHQTLTDAQANDLLAGKWYFNVHTAQHPGGEIRGQVLRTN